MYDDAGMSATNCMPIKPSALPEHKTREFLTILQHIPVGGISQIIHDFLFFGERVVVLPAGEEVKSDGDLLLTDTSRVAVCYWDQQFVEETILSSFQDDPRYPWFDGTLTDKQWEYLIVSIVEMLSLEAGDDSVFNAWMESLVADRIDLESDDSN